MNTNILTEIYDLIKESHRTYNAGPFELKMNRNTAERIISSSMITFPDYSPATSVFGIPVIFDETLPNGWIVREPDQKIIVIGAAIQTGEPTE